MALTKLLTMWRVAYILVSMHPYIFSSSLCCENLYKTDCWRKKQTISDSMNTTNTRSWDVYANPDNGSSSVWAQKENAIVNIPPGGRWSGFPPETCNEGPEHLEDVVDG